MKLHPLLTAAAASGIAANAGAAVLFSNTDDLGSLPASGISAATVADPAPDAPGDMAGSLTNITMKFSSVSTGVIPLPAAAIGNPFSASIDFYVPTDTDLNAGDLVYLQININGSNRGSAGFIDAGAVSNQGTWQNITLNSLNFPPADPTNGPNLPPGANDVNIQFIIVDGGFGGAADFPTAGGTALLVDNFTFEAVPEPGSALLGGLGGLALLRRRRRG